MRSLLEPSDRNSGVFISVCGRAHIACRPQSVSASHSLIKINIEESNRRDRGEERDKELTDLLGI